MCKVNDNGDDSIDFLGRWEVGGGDDNTETVFYYVPCKCPVNLNFFLGSPL